MRKIFLFTVLLLSSYFLRAQLDSFDLSTYKLPDITRHQLDFNIDLDGRSYTSDQYYRNKEDNYNTSNRFDGDLNLDYAFYRNSDKIQSNQMFNLDFRPSFYDNKNDKIRRCCRLLLLFSDNNFIEVSNIKKRSGRILSL